LGEPLREVAGEAKHVALSYGRAAAALRWETFAESLEIVGLLLEWLNAVAAAELEADRFLRAARKRIKELQARKFEDRYCIRLIEILNAVDGEPRSQSVELIRSAICAEPMPVAIYADPEPERPDWARNSKHRVEEPADIAVAFVEFKINGTVAERLQHLRPGEMHDLDIAVRVSRWPDKATSLVLSPMSIEPPSSYDLPVFRFDRPIGEPPFLFQQRGRMALRMAQNLKARPFEFMYTAEFFPVASDQPVSIAGQRTLRLNGSKSDQPITGYPAIDRKMLSLRDRLRVEPLIPEQDLDDLLQVLVPLGNLMGQSVQDALFPTVISEAEFQARVREFLRRHPALGVNVEEQAHSAGGRTDLSYRGIRIELKSETKVRLLPDDCKRYAGQAASYAVGTNRRVAVLCVLDCSPKETGPFPMEDGLFVFPFDTGTSHVYIVACLVQGNIPKPSSHSR